MDIGNMYVTGDTLRLIERMQKFYADGLAAANKRKHKNYQKISEMTGTVWDLDHLREHVNHAINHDGKIALDESGCWHCRNARERHDQYIAGPHRKLHLGQLLGDCLICNVERASTKAHAESKDHDHANCPTCKAAADPLPATPET